MTIYKQLENGEQLGSNLQAELHYAIKVTGYIGGTEQRDLYMEGNKK
jgi:hypothetical protein